MYFSNSALIYFKALRKLPSPWIIYNEKLNKMMLLNDIQKQFENNFIKYRYHDKKVIATIQGLWRMRLARSIMKIVYDKKRRSSNRKNKRMK